jgi:hypothetical protein
VTKGLQEQIKFMNRGSTVLSTSNLYKKPFPNIKFNYTPTTEIEITTKLINFMYFPSSTALKFIQLTEHKDTQQWWQQQHHHLWPVWL